MNWMAILIGFVVMSAIPAGTYAQEGKGHYSPGSPYYMAGQSHYSQDSPYYMAGKEHYRLDSSLELPAEKKRSFESSVEPTTSKGTKVTPEGAKEAAFPDTKLQIPILIEEPETPTTGIYWGIPIYHYCSPKIDQRRPPRGAVLNSHTGNRATYRGTIPINHP
jgi:hypothetical protein